MQARKLPSGSWRCQVLWYTDKNGKKVRKSFTCNDPSPKGKRKCEAEAAAWAANKPPIGNGKKNIHKLTFADALDRYISDREAVLSPSSIRKYRAMQKNHFAEVRDMVLEEISQEDVQDMVNRMIHDGYSSKTITEITSMVSTIQKRYDLRTFSNTIKPKRKRKKKKLAPTDSQLLDLLEASKDGPMYLPIMIAAFCGLRRGEVAALDVGDIDKKKKILHVHKNMVDIYGGGWIIKEPKTEDGDRYIPVPKCVIDLLPDSGRITLLNPGMITSRFEHLAKKCNLPAGITFHSLRHYTTSVKLMLGENDLVVRKEMGWSEKDFQEMKEIYGHTVEGHQYSEKACDYFENVMKKRQNSEEVLTKVLTK